MSVAINTRSALTARAFAAFDGFRQFSEIYDDANIYITSAFNALKESLAAAPARSVSDASPKAEHVTPARNDVPRTRKMTDEQRAKLRSIIVADMWEPDLRRELVDRIVDLVDFGDVSASEVKKQIAAAKEKKNLFRSTSGEKGRESVWQTMATWVRRQWESKGLEWRRTSMDLEPMPTKKQQRQEDDKQDSGDRLSEEETHAFIAQAFERLKKAPTRTVRRYKLEEGDDDRT